MANHGTGNRFASVNLNKSYGHGHSSHGFNNGSNRARSSGNVGGGMVVLSRPRSSHKSAPKLSVPPPLNLPSIRKEHERFDSLGSIGGSGSGGGIANAGTRPSSSGLGWSKPSVIVTSERDGVSNTDRPLSSDGGVVSSGMQSGDRVSQGGGSSYGGSSVRSSTVGPDVSMGKSAVLRGEDFPSLRATLAAANVPATKNKDSQKPRQGMMSEDSSSRQREGSHSQMRPQLHAHRSNDHNSMNSGTIEQGRKQEEFFPGPLPLVRLSPRSDWADDERDTSHGLMDRGKDHSFTRSQAYWDEDFDFPRSNFPPQKPAQHHFDRRGQHDNDVGKGSSNEVSDADSFNRDVRMTNREGQSWRRPVSRDGFSSHEVVSDKGRSETAKENKYAPSHFGGNNQHRDFGAGRRDPGYVQGGRQHWNSSADLDNSAGTERNIRDRYEPNRFNKVDAIQNNMGSKSSFSAGGRGQSGSDRLSNFGRDKRSLSRGEKVYAADPFVSSDFDMQDPFSGGILGVVKRKKDANKHQDFHDPVRESFEAELERVQKLQEQERQRAIEEQERAMEIARREEEERRRVAMEQEEHQRRLEEEAREAAWREEQERLEAIRRAEEQRLAREEEKQRMLMEEERRRQAAKQKLQELEERMARRQAEAGKPDGASDVQGDRMRGIVKERDMSRADDFAAWEDGERMVERITNTASSDSSISRPFDMSSRPVAVGEGSFGFADRGKSVNSWRRDAFENVNSSSFFSSEHENGYQSPRQDAFAGGRGFPRKDFFSGSGYNPVRGYYRGRSPADSQMEDFHHASRHRWSSSLGGDPYGRNAELDVEINESIGGKIDVDWGQAQGQGRGCSPFPERLYQNSELEDLYSYGRSRYPARQPRVLPPPSLSSVHRTSFREENEQAWSSSAYQDGNIQFDHTSAASHQNVQEELSDKLNELDMQERCAKNEPQELNRSHTPGCDSQSSLCVSSAPSSPTQLSHDDLDDATRDSLAVTGTAEAQDISNSENEAVLPKGKDGKVTPTSMSVGDDDEEWTVENNELQQEEEYSEDVHYNGEVQNGDDDVELSREFEGMHLERNGSPHMTDNVVLGFDQGVEVGMPNEECERSPTVAYVGPEVMGATAELNESVDESRDETITHAVDGSQHLSTDASCLTVESENVVQDYASEPVNVPDASKSFDCLGSNDSSSVLTTQQPVSSAVGVSSQSQSSNWAGIPSAGGAPVASEVPVKLQFGLFSGPSLIPSPVPAIQIGSIQMPLQFPPQIAPPLSHMHAPHRPLFQFGQLRYPAPIPQGFSPLPSQPMSFLQPTAISNYPSGQRYGVPSSVQPIKNSSTQNSLQDDSLPPTVNTGHAQPPSQLNLTPCAELEQANATSREFGANDVAPESQAGTSAVAQITPESRQQSEIVGQLQNSVRSTKPLNSRISESRAQGVPSSSHLVANIGDSSGPRAQGVSGYKGRRFVVKGRNPGGRLTSQPHDVYRSDVNVSQRRRRGTQRFEFRVRQAADGEQSGLLQPPNYSGSESLSNYSDGNSSGTQHRSGPKTDIPSDRSKPTADSLIPSSDQVLTRNSGSEIKEDKPTRKQTTASGTDSARSAEGSLKRSIYAEDDVDAPLQSGIVRVFKQPGIEAPSDEDDFIEVRSKRQMLNDRREQREKEIKAKSSNVRKAQRRSRPATQATTAVRNNGRGSASSSARVVRNMQNGVVPKQGVVNNEVPVVVNKIVSQTLAPIGTPTNADSQGGVKAQNIKPPQLSPCATAEQTIRQDLAFHSPSNTLGSVHPSVGSQGSSQSNPLVMTLKQTQHDEGMKPVQFDKDVASVGDRTGSLTETGVSSSSLLAKDKSLTSGSSPVSCLLAGGKIQFGAVTSPTILPPSSRVVSYNLRAPSSQVGIHTSQGMPASENDRVRFDKEKHGNLSCGPLDDCDAEAEAAASAVAVAAISNDEVVGPGLCSASVSVSKDLQGAAVDAIVAGMPGEVQAVTHSKGEESLSVSLPADLSVETPHVSLLPHLPSPHGSSQMHSPFSGGLPSHFPFYDVNPIMGGPVFAFSPPEESGGSQPQPQKTNAPGAGPVGTWQQCHPGVYSFYGPAGFTAPFVRPPGSMPDVQGLPPRMVVYNHFAPVGQFGQVGLSYMGSTYVPSGNQPQPDWKHHPASSTMGGGEGETNSLNMVPVPRSAHNVPPQVQHGAPGSPLLSMASPMAMFEVSPFQSAPDASVLPRWPPVQASSLHSIPQPMPMQQQQQPEGTMPAQINHSDHQPLAAASGFPKSQTSSGLADGSSVTLDTNAAVAQLSDQLGSVNPPVSCGSVVTTLNVGDKADSVGIIDESLGAKKNSQGVSSTSHKAQPGRHRYSHYQRGGAQKSNSMAEWSNRKVGFHGRSHSSGGERGFPPTKVKQIYVAKQNTTGTTKSVES